MHILIRETPSLRPTCNAGVLDWTSLIGFEFEILCCLHVLGVTCYLVIVLDRSQDHSHGYKWTTIRRFKATHSREHINLPAPCHPGVRRITWIWL